MCILSSKLYLAGFVKLPPFFLSFLRLSVTSTARATNSLHFVVSRPVQRAPRALENNNFNQFFIPYLKIRNTQFIFYLLEIFETIPPSFKKTGDNLCCAFLMLDSRPRHQGTRYVLIVSGVTWVRFWETHLLFPIIRFNFTNTGILRFESTISAKFRLNINDFHYYSLVPLSC